MWSGVEWKGGGGVKDLKPDAIRSTVRQLGVAPHLRRGGKEEEGGTTYTQNWPIIFFPPSLLSFPTSVLRSFSPPLSFSRCDPFHSTRFIFDDR